MRLLAEKTIGGLDFTMKRIALILMATVIFCGGLLAGWILARIGSAEIGETTLSADWSSSVVALAKQGRFEEALELVESEIRQNESNALAYHTLADLCMMRAYSQPADRARLLQRAEAALEKGLMVSPKDPINLHQIGVRFELMGDRATNGCPYYEKAQTMFRDELVQLQPEEIVVQGKSLETRPLRDSTSRLLSRVGTKIDQHCR